MGYHKYYGQNLGLSTRYVYYFQAVDPLARLKYSLTGSGEVHNSLGSIRTAPPI